MVAFIIGQYDCCSLQDDGLDEDFGGLTLGTGQSAKDSSKEDDIQAICEQRGAGANAPLARQLQAIDEEYKYLLDQGQSGKADYVQNLYVWKSKQATQVRRSRSCVPVQVSIRPGTEWQSRLCTEFICVEI